MEGSLWNSCDPTSGSAQGQCLHDKKGPWLPGFAWVCPEECGLPGGLPAFEIYVPGLMEPAVS